MLAQFASSADVDLIDLIELSDLRNKKETIDKIKQRRQEAAEAAQGAVQMEQADKQASIEQKQAQTAKTFTEAQGKQLENEIIEANPRQSQALRFEYRLKLS